MTFFVGFPHGADGEKANLKVVDVFSFVLVAGDPQAAKVSLCMVFSPPL